MVRLGFVLMLVSMFFGCSDKDNCVPGATQVCQCGGGKTGSQACKSDGSGWETCQNCSGTTKQDSGTGTKSCPSQLLHPVNNKFCIDKFDRGGALGSSSYKTKSQAISICKALGKNGKVCSVQQIDDAIKNAGLTISAPELATVDSTGCCCPCGSYKGSPQHFWTPTGGVHGFKRGKCECWWINRSGASTFFRCCTDY